MPRDESDPMMTIAIDTKMVTQLTAPGITTKGWLEIDGNPQSIAVHGDCTIGRLRENTVCIAHERVSRRHAIIRAQGGEFCLVDFGSVNGTFLNNRRLQAPCMLRDGDRITVVSCEMTFRMQTEPASGAAGERTGPYDDQTMRAVEEPEMWLLLADIEGFTAMSQRMSASDMAQLVGVWLQTGRQIIETHQGTVNKYLGDGYFAYWRQAKGVDAHIYRALKDLHEQQQKARPAFRVVLHRGVVAVGGSGWAGEESILGPEVNLLFRAEKLASTLRERCLITAAAAEKMPHLRTRPLGQHKLDGFADPVTVFGYET